MNIHSFQSLDGPKAECVSDHLSNLETPVRVCLVGLGRAGHFHLQSLKIVGPRVARLVCVCDINKDLADKVAEDFGNGCMAFGSLEEIFNNNNSHQNFNQILDTIDAVIIASTTDTHYNLCKIALQSNKACFTEKPISHHPNEVLEIIDLAKKVKVPFIVGYQRRCDRNFRALRDLIANGELGGSGGGIKLSVMERNSAGGDRASQTQTVVVTGPTSLPTLPLLFSSGNSGNSVSATGSTSLNNHMSPTAKTTTNLNTNQSNRFKSRNGVRVIKCTSRDNPLPPLAYLKTSGGIFHDMLSHDFDMIHFLTGGEIPEEVYTIAHCYEPAIAAMDDVDTVMVSLRYSSGLIATVDCSRIAEYGYDQRVEVFGEKGMLTAENEVKHTVELATNKGHLRPCTEWSFPERYRHTYTVELTEFVNMVKMGIVEEDYLIERHALLGDVARAAEKSWREGRNVKLRELD